MPPTANVCRKIGSEYGQLAPTRRHLSWRSIWLSVLATSLGFSAACGQSPGSDSDGSDEPAMAFVASSRGQVYYWSECDNWRSIPPANRRWFGTTAEAEAGGYRPSTARGCEAPELREGPTPVHTNRCTVIRVIDGDTVVCEEAWERIRLILIDAPETGQGQAATDARVALESLLPLGTIARLELDVQERDSYGRILGYLYTPAGEFVNETLARQGFAVTLVVPPNVRHVDRIRSAVDEARRAGRGLWAGSAFECAPADYRAGRCDR